METKIILRPSDSHEHWVVEWPDYSPVSFVKGKKELLKVIFETINCNDEVGFLHKNETVHWISPVLYWSKSPVHEFLEDIMGVVFADKDDAVALKDDIDKRIVWRTLAS